MVARWPKHTKYYGLSPIDNNIHCYLYAIRLFLHCQRHSECKYSTDSERQLPNHLFGAECHTHCYTFCCGRNLCLVTGWTEYAEYNSKSYYQYNVHSHILIVGMFFYCQWNGECKHGTNCRRQL